MPEQFALVTGGARGIGAATAKLIAQRGARVAVCDVLRDEGEATASAIRAAGGDAVFAFLDVTEEASWSAVAERVQQEFNGLHILVNNAGLLTRHGIMDTSLTDWERVMDVNTTGPFLGMKTLAPMMRNSGGGSIINISSIAGLTGHPDAAYASSKWAVRGLTKVAALEFADWNIRVNSIHPGMVRTAFQNSAPPGHVEANRAAIPLGREADPDEIARLIAFLASSEASFITGAEIAVDGGFVAAGLMRLRAERMRHFSVTA